VKFRYINVPGILSVGDFYLISGGTGFEGCAEVITYEDSGSIYSSGGVTFTQQDNCLDLDCPPCPSPTPTPTVTSSSPLNCNCLSYTIINPYDVTEYLAYEDCFSIPQNIEIDPVSTTIICACEGSLFNEGSLIVTQGGECPPPAESPLPTPTPTPTITVTPSNDWNLCDDDFCLVTYDPTLDLYNGTYSVSGSSLYNNRYVFSGDVTGVIYYNSTTLQWCLSDTIGGSCLLGGPSPSTSSCPDLWSVIFTNGVCNTTTSTTSPCDVFDFDAYFDCDVPVTPSPTPTNTPTPSFTPTPTPTTDICNYFTGDIGISGYTTTTTTTPSVTTTTTTVCYSASSGSVTFTVVNSLFICPGEVYVFIDCVTSQIYYVEPINAFADVDLNNGYTYSFNINGVPTCATFDGVQEISPNVVASGPVSMFTSCEECDFSTPTPTPTPTVTPTQTNTPSQTPTVTPTISPTNTSTPTVTPTITNTPTVTITPSSSEPLVEYYALVNGTYCCGDLPAITNMLVRRIGFPIQNGFVYYDGEGNCFTITSNTSTVAGPGFTDITTNFVDCSSCRNNNLTFFLAGYCYDGRMLADSGSPFTNCLQVQSGLGSATRYRSNYPYSYLFTGQWQTVDMYIMDVTTNCLLVSKPISDGCQYWETNSLGIVSIGYPQSGFDCVPAGGPCCPGTAPS
jgi:hypothetical protein